ncbi:MAG: patatin-like phospholipase family protein [Polyangiaceae bacterium]
MDQGRVPAAVSVHEPMPARTHVLTNGDAAAAVHASCAVPVLFHPVRIGGRLYVDGGVSDRPGLRGMPSGERVLFHHIASRSPWRRFDLEGMRVPPREDMITLVIDDLPRSGPFKLDLGRRALREARRAARMALDRPIGSGKVHVSAW